MKPKLSIGLSILISAVLVVFGLVYGNVSGFADERAHVNALFSGENGITAVLQYRASDGLNLCVVADRHLTGDGSVAALRQAAQAMRAEETSPIALKAKDAALADAFAAVATKLRASTTFAASARDPQYLSMLEADLAQYADSAIYAAYNKAAAEYNRKLLTPVLGDIARFFGIKPCELY